MVLSGGAERVVTRLCVCGKIKKAMTIEDQVVDT
jgi:hypothetical protein